MSKPEIDIIVTHYDEPWNVGKRFFEMLAMQRLVEFDEFRVIVVQDGKENALDWQQLLADYPYTVKIATIDHSGVCAARNAGLKVATADWVMFCDFDDSFEDLYAISMAMSVIPNNDADIMWMNSVREECQRGGNFYANMIGENFTVTFGKLYRRQALNEHAIRFPAFLKYEYEQVFNSLCVSVIPNERVLHMTNDIMMYSKAYRPDSYSMRREVISDRIESVYFGDVYLVNEFIKRGLDHKYILKVAETVFDMYYMLNSKPSVTHRQELFASFKSFWAEHKSAFDRVGQTEKEIVLDISMNKMIMYVQSLYNYHLMEVAPPVDGIRHITAWLNTFSTEPIAANTPEQPAQERVIPVPPAIVLDPRFPDMRSDDNTRAVVYCGTYNTYANIYASIKSLMATTYIDRVYLLIEDDTFPYDIPDCVTVMNVKNQTWFTSDGPNYKNVWSYMCMMRAVFPKLFTNLSRILSLDIDVVITEDIGELWDIDLSDYYLAGVPEPCRQKRTGDPIYINFGVVMMNLDKLRADGIDDKAIQMLNTQKCYCPEQDAFNKLCANHIYALPNRFNFTPFSHITGESDRETIIHYAGLKYWKHFEPVRRYSTMSWDDVFRLRSGESIPQHTEPSEPVRHGRVAVYVGNRNTYRMMALSAKSLLYHTHIDDIYFLIEDDAFPGQLPDCIHVMNVSNQSFFRPDGPNYNSYFSYMPMLRAAYPKLFPQYDRILSIDCDILFDHDISVLFALDISAYYFAAALEARYGKPVKMPYYNTGLMLMNLKKMREDNIDTETISDLNTKTYTNDSQDALNEQCYGHVLELPSDYNACQFTRPTDHVIVHHYAGPGKPKDDFFRDADLYEHMSWDDVMQKYTGKKEGEQIE